MDTTIIANASLNASEMVCGCLEKSAALYWGNALSESAYWLSHFLDIVFVMTFVFGVVVGILLLLAADWLYKRWQAKQTWREKPHGK
jgi:hypothetical protein